jgi:hypothetical protein
VSNRYYSNHNIDEVKEILSEIFLEVSDRTSEKWFHWVDKNSGSRGDEYQIQLRMK